MISLTSTSGGCPIANAMASAIADAARRASIAVREGVHLVVDSESC
jgi:metal-sulfur cluster biosynthetic enzyme